MEAGLISDEDGKDLSSQILHFYDFEPEKMLEKIRANIESESIKKDLSTDTIELDTMLSNMRKAIENGTPKAEVLSLLWTKKKYYNPIPRNEGENDDEYKERVKSINKTLLRLNMAMLEFNPNKRYDVTAMSMLSDIRKSLRAGKALACATGTHCLSIHDCKLYNGRWFILVKDPHNINSFVYTKKNGEVNADKSLFNKTAKVTQFKRISTLDGTMESALLGTSWWELGDAAKMIQFYTTCP